MIVESRGEGRNIDTSTNCYMNSYVTHKSNPLQEKAEYKTSDVL